METNSFCRVLVLRSEGLPCRRMKKCLDWCLQIIQWDSSMLPTCRLLALSKALHTDKNWKNERPPHFTMKVEPSTRVLALNGRDACLQFYCPYTNSHKLTLQVVPRNKVSKTDSQPISQPEIVHFVFSSDGNWLITYDEWDDGMTTPEKQLKVWQKNAENLDYSLHTRFSMPHTDTTSIAFKPSAKHSLYTFVTTGADNCFKIWQYSKQDDSWTCVKKRSYRDFAPRDAKFSHDGSVLAITFRELLTIWHGETFEFKTVLNYSHPSLPLTNVHFVGLHHIVAYSEAFLYVWDLLNCSVRWSLKITVQEFAAVPGSAAFTIVHNHRESGSSNAALWMRLSSTAHTLLQRWRHQSAVHDQQTIERLYSVLQLERPGKCFWMYIRKPKLVPVPTDATWPQCTGYRQDGADGCWCRWCSFGAHVGTDKEPLYKHFRYSKQVWQRQCGCWCDCRRFGSPDAHPKHCKDARGADAFAATSR